MISLSICISVYQNFLQVLIFLKVWSIIVVLKYKFIVLHILELLYINLMLVVYESTLTIYPFFLSQLNFFLVSSLYNYQYELWTEFYFLCYKVIIYTVLLYYSLFIPIITYWLDELNLYQKLSILINVDIELQLLIYLIWFIKLNYILIYVIVYIVVLIKIVQYFININNVYTFLKQYKKVLLVCVLTLLFIVLPSNNILQPFIFILTLLILEIIFIYINYKYSLIYKWVH